MCLSDEKQQPVFLKKQSFNKPVRKHRRKLWELEERLHCPVIGTCLTIEDLKRLMRQSGMVLEAKASDFDYHVTLVHAAGEKSQVTRNLQKLLDKRFKRHLKKLSKVNSEQELAAHWQQALADDEIPGMLWAVITHPLLDRSLVDEVYGEIHMLSHLSGQSHRKALGRIPMLEAECEELNTALKKQRAVHEMQLAERDERISALEKLVTKLRQDFATGGEVKHHPDDKVLQARYQRLQSRNDWLTQNLATTRQALDEQSTLRSVLNELLLETREQLKQSERNLAQLVKHLNGDHQQTKAVPDLSGRKVVYIGGRRSLAPHLRSVVEGCCGSFTHHDGGVEESRANLDQKLTGADVVFCPVDCISHDACLRVKRCCKRTNTQFIPLRSSGVTSLLNGLQLVSKH
jgi:DNA repair exonuclease SbcCD ATPase subunit